jgi:hypothetical protein
MKINTGILFVLMFTAIAFVLGFAATDLWAKGKKEMVELDEAEIFFEENATDKDLGIQLFLDGDAWTRIKIYDPLLITEFSLHKLPDYFFDIERFSD